MIVYYLQTQGFYPKVHIDVEVSSGKDDVSKTDALTDKKKVPDGDDAEDGGASSAEPITPNLIRFDAPEQADPSIADRAASGRGHALKADRSLCDPIVNLKRSALESKYICT
jgi:hypothetical protein